MGEDLGVHQQSPANRDVQGKLLTELRAFQSRVGGRAAAVGRETAKVPAPGQVSPRIRAFIRTILRVRAQRRAVFGSSLFGEPSWDMLLELYDAHFKARRECVSSLCIASGVPSTTALRWIGHLEQEGWIARVPDAHDRRRYYVELSKRGLEAMTQVLGSILFPDGD